MRDAFCFLFDRDKQLLSGLEPVGILDPVLVQFIEILPAVAAAELFFSDLPERIAFLDRVFLGRNLYRAFDAFLDLGDIFAFIDLQRSFGKRDGRLG